MNKNSYWRLEFRFIFYCRLCKFVKQKFVSLKFKHCSFSAYCISVYEFCWLIRYRCFNADKRGVIWSIYFSSYALCLINISCHCGPSKECNLLHMWFDYLIWWSHDIFSSYRQGILAHSSIQIKLWILINWKDKNMLYL